MAGETILIHGGASGVGTSAIELAKAFAPVFVTAGKPRSARACRSSARKVAINYKTEDLVEVVKRATGHGVDAILDMIGAMMSAPATYQAWPSRGMDRPTAIQKGARAELQIRRLMVKRLWQTGSTPPRSVEFKAPIARYAVTRRFGPCSRPGPNPAGRSPDLIR